MYFVEHLKKFTNETDEEIKIYYKHSMWFDHRTMCDMNARPRAGYCPRISGTTFCWPETLYGETATFTEQYPLLD